MFEKTQNLCRTNSDEFARVGFNQAPDCIAVLFVGFFFFTFLVSKDKISKSEIINRWRN